MRDRRFKIRIEDSKTGEVDEFKTNTCIILTADATEEPRKVDISGVCAGNGTIQELDGLLDAVKKEEVNLTRRLESEIIKSLVRATSVSMKRTEA